MAHGGGLTGDRIAGIALAILGGAIAVETRKLPIGSLADPGPGYLPLVLAGLIAALGILIAVSARRGGRSGSVRWPEGGHALQILGSCAFAAVAIEPLGYRLTIAVLLIFLLGVVERKPPLAVAAVSVLLAFGTHYLFAGVLRVVLPTGPWGI